MASNIDFARLGNIALPRQQMELSKKLQKLDKFGVSEWMKNCMDTMESIARYSYYFNIPLRENYQIVSKEFNLKHYYRDNDYYDLTSAISQEFEIPYHLKHYDITGKAVNLLVGEYLKRPDTFSVRAADAETDNEYLRVKTDLLHSYLEQSIGSEIATKLVNMGLDPNRNEFKNDEEEAQYKQMLEEKYKELTPKSIEKYMKYDYRSAAEHWGQAVLSNDRKRLNFPEMEKVEFTDMLIADRCFSHMFLTPTGYSCEYWNPLNTFFHQSPEVPKIEEGDYAGRIYYLSKAQVVDRYGWRMHKKQIEMLYPSYSSSDEAKKDGVYGEFFSSTMFPFPAYRDYAQITGALGYDPFNAAPLGLFPTQADLSTQGFPLYQFATGDIVQVTEAYWRSQMKIGKLYIVDEETGEEKHIIVDENFDPKLYGISEYDDTWQIAEDEQPPNSIVWTWVTQIWQGVKVNANMNSFQEEKDRNAVYFDIRPCPFQFKGDFTPFQPKLPVCGGIFSNRNGKSNSMVDLLKPYQIAYNAFVNQAYGIAQRNNGKMLLLNLRLMPGWKDWGGEDKLEKVMSIAREAGFIPVDDSAANLNGNLSFNQNTVLDMDESERVERLLKLAIIFEDQGFKQIGITPQRQGDVQASETATGTNTALDKSYAITEPYFQNFYNYKRRKMNMLLEMAQYCASKEKSIDLSYTTSDLGKAYVSITGTEIFLKNLGVHVDNAADTYAELELARKLAIENNTTKLPMSGLISMISLKSVADIQKKLQELEEQQMQEAQIQREHEQQLADKQIQAKKEEEMMKMEHESAEKQLDRENKIEIEKLKGIANEGSYNPDVDKTAELIEQSKLALQESKQSSDASLAQRQLINQQLADFEKSQLEKSKQEHDKKIKADEAKHKRQIELEKLRQIKEQNQSQEKLSKDKHKNDLLLIKEKLKAEMALKNKELELKDKDLEIKKFEVENRRKEGLEKVKQIQTKTNTEKKIGDAKVDEIKTIADVKKDEVKKLSEIKVHEAKEKSKDNIKLNKEKAKVQKTVQSIVGKQKIKEAKNPKKPK